MEAITYTKEKVRGSYNYIRMELSACLLASSLLHVIKLRGNVRNTICIKKTFLCCLEGGLGNLQSFLLQVS